MQVKKKKAALDEVLGDRIRDSYESQYQFIMEEIEKGKIIPVRSSAKNGRKPALHTAYWVVTELPDSSAYEEELLYGTDPAIRIDYYLKHPDVYARERPYVRALNRFLKSDRESLLVRVSLNERSFRIWGEEKYLANGGGQTLLTHCGMSLKDLNLYLSAEPFAYFASHRKTPQKILILENKDPFFGMRRHLLEGHRGIFGTEIGTLIYGGGKRVLSSFKEFAVSAEPYMREAGNEFLYFGDLDYEGIGICENLMENTAGPCGCRVRPFVPAYKAMLDKGELCARLPRSKEHQNRHIRDLFFSFFEDGDAKRMTAILEKGLYIPQEIFTVTDY